MVTGGGARGGAGWVGGHAAGPRARRPTHSGRGHRPAARTRKPWGAAAVLPCSHSCSSLLRLKAAVQKKKANPLQGTRFGEAPAAHAPPWAGVPSGPGGGRGCSLPAGPVSPRGPHLAYVYNFSVPPQSQLVPLGQHDPSSFAGELPAPPKPPGPASARWGMRAGPGPRTAGAPYTRAWARAVCVR